MSRSFFAFTCVALLAAPVATAQTNTSTASRILAVNHANGITITEPTLSSGASYWYINRHDCRLDSYPHSASDTAKVRVRATDPNGNTTNFGPQPQIWIGANCNLAANRVSSTTVPCTRAISTTNGATVDPSTTGVYLVDLAALFPADTTKTSFDICNAAAGGGKLEFWMMSAAEGTSTDVSSYVYFYLNGDTGAPSPVTITTTSPSGDNEVTLRYTSNSTIETNSNVFYFAIADGCMGGGAGDAGVDAGSSDAGSDDGGVDGGTGTGMVRTGSDYPVTGQIPPDNAPGIVFGSLGVDGDSSIKTSELGLTASGDGASLGLAVRDAALNYSVVSNVVCVRKVDTYGLCDTAGNCPQGDCTVSPTGRMSIVAVCAMVAAALALVRRRGLRP